MKLRAVIIDDDPFIRSMLERVLLKRDYEVIALPDATMCPAVEGQSCRCREGEVCADIVILDLNLDMASGLDFAETLRRRGCRARHVALMSGAWSGEDAARAATMGCRMLQKPFSITEIQAWLDVCEKTVDPMRRLRQRS